MPKNFNFFSVVVNLTKLVSGDKSTLADELGLPQSATTSFTSSDSLGRIAHALERIATALEKQNATPVKKDDISRITDNTSANKLPIKSTNSTSAQPQVTPANNDKKDVSLSSFSDLSIAPQIEIAVQTTESIFTASKEQSVLRNYLASLDITYIETVATENQSELDKLALYLGQNFTTCQDMYKLLKRNMIAPQSKFTYDLKGATLEKNKIIQEFCRLLEEAQLIEKPNYNGKPNYNFELRATGKEQKYLCGSWLENYVKVEVVRILTATKQPFEVLPNLQVVFKELSKTELDLFFSLRNRVFCIETKMRPASADLLKQLNRIKPLTLDNKALLIVVAEKSQEECEKLTKELGNVKVVRLENLEPALLSLIK